MSSEATLSYATGEASNETPINTAYLVVAIDCQQPTTPSLRLSLSEIEVLRVGRGDVRHYERVAISGSAVLKLTLADRHLSSRHAEIRRVRSGYELVDLDSKNGCFVNGEQTRSSTLSDGDVIHVGSTTMLFRDGIERYPNEPIDIDGGTVSDQFITLSPPLARDISKAARCATTSLSILLNGASGTGKEVAARWLHRLSGRRGDFVAINCGALPATLIESELFGSKRGAFSGADRDRVGLIRAADGGTLFLDEIGELPLAAQVKLLRVLQEKEVTAVGGTSPVRVDIRVISATLRDLDSASEAGEFRPDLLARIAGFRIRLPTLSARREDIGHLVSILIERHKDATTSANPIRLDREAARALLQYDWPNNVRELEQTLHAAIALAQDRAITVTDLPEPIGASLSLPSPTSALITGDDDALRKLLITKLREHKGNISAIARSLGKARVQVRRWCDRFDLDAASYRS